jgi:hypothetical protein
MTQDEVDDFVIPSISFTSRPSHLGNDGSWDPAMSLRKPREATREQVDKAVSHFIDLLHAGIVPMPYKP